MSPNRGPKGDPGEPGEKGNSAPLPKSIIRAFIIITIIFFIILYAFSRVVIDIKEVSDRNIKLTKSYLILSQENKSRIKEIQASRIESCKHTYRGVREVLRPFYPPVPRTVDQIAELNRFNTTVNKLIHGCVKQTDPNKG